MSCWSQAASDARRRAGAERAATATRAADIVIRAGGPAAAVAGVTAAAGWPRPAWGRSPARIGNRVCPGERTGAADARRAGGNQDASEAVAHVPVTVDGRVACGRYFMGHHGGHDNHGPPRAHP